MFLIVYNMENNADNILTNLYLGNYSASRDKKFIKNNNIKHIITVMVEFDINSTDNGVCYYHIPLKDHEHCYNVNMNYTKLFDDISLLINSLLKLNNGSILVHCKRGHHRSAAIVAYYLAKYNNMSIISAINYIKSKRPTSLTRNCCIVNSLFNN